MQKATHATIALHNRGSEVYYYHYHTYTTIQLPTIVSALSIHIHNYRHIVLAITQTLLPIIINIDYSSIANYMASDKEESNIIID